MTVEACAKVNLTLEVFGRRPDGYHALRSLVAPISLADTLDIEPTDDGTVTSDTGFPDDLCVKAACALRNSQFPDSRSPCPLPGAHIRVAKRIPVGGGLGGGSADAAATLRALNGLWNLGKTPEELAGIAASVGSDVPALVLAQEYGCIVLMEGRGEKVAPFPATTAPLGRDALSRPLVLANPGVNVSTAEIFGLCSPRTVPAPRPVNDLEGPAVARHPEIGRTLEALRAAGAADVMMSGSGATCFGFAADEECAVRISSLLEKTGLRTWSCRILA